jgi:6-phosphogluconolactonase
MMCGMETSPRRLIRLHPDIGAIVRDAAALISERIQSSISDRGRCALALSGGTSVGSVFELLAADPNIRWPDVFFFWGDDRFIDQSNPHNSFKLAEEKLFAKTPAIPRKNIFPVPVDAPTPTEGAKRYSQTIQTFFGLAPGEWPRFDIAINGMGPDGHTASLFPHSPALDEHDQIAVMNHAGLTPWVDRVTLTFPVFNHARCIVFMVTGSGKAQTLQSVLEGASDVHRFPTQGIQPADGEVIWLLDPSAAALLNNKGLAS